MSVFPKREPKPCCCGRIQDCDMPTQINDTVHEVYGPAGNFCGPRLHHDIRDMEEKIVVLMKAVRDMSRVAERMKQFATGLKPLATPKPGVVETMEEADVRLKAAFQEAVKEVGPMYFEYHPACGFQEAWDRMLDDAGYVRKPMAEWNPDDNPHSANAIAETFVAPEDKP